MAVGCRFLWIGIFFCLFLGGCKEKALNSPHPQESPSDNTVYSAFLERPKTLDPAKSYSLEENTFIAQIYEPPLEYHYLLRPYELIPLTVTALPKVEYFSENNQLLPDNAPTKKVAYSTYTLHIKPHIEYSPHPAFVKDKNGNYIYHFLSEEEAKDISTLKDFKKKATRELTAEDYVYEIKRLADPQVSSPIYGFLSEYILGMKEYSKELEKIRKENAGRFLDLRRYPFKGAVATDKYTYRIFIKGKYPQFIHWLAMPFFSPMPWEADEFYSQSNLQKRNITLDWYPIGTGPYFMKENNPNQQIVLEKNPNYHEDPYPTKGMPEDVKRGLLKDAGKMLPFVHRYVFNLEKESLPYWNKFLQGYYDRSGITADNYDTAIQVSELGGIELTKTFKNRGIQLNTSTDPSIYYLGFNMLDPIVGGYGEKAGYLRQAISIALNMEEYISIFLNGRGLPAQGPIPEGIFGYEAGEKGINPFVYTWKQSHIERLPLEVAKQLLAKAGYPNGQDEKTGKPLILNYDAVSNGNPDERAMMEWMRKQFSKLNIQLYVRATNYNRFQEKLRTGNAQIFFLGWSADYPDPENFLFLLYGPNGKVKYGGENATNYENPLYDESFLKMKNELDTKKRLELIQTMLGLVRKDSPWVWGFYPKTFILSHQWVGPTKPNVFARNSLKYLRIQPERRKDLQELWNPPIFWPLYFILGIFFLLLLPVVIRYIKKQRASAERFKDD